MKIELTNEQYRTLVEAVAIAHAVTDETLDGGDSEDEVERSAARHGAMRSLEDYVVQHAPLFDALDLVENEAGLLSLNEEAMGRIMNEVILPYDEAVFWQELEDRLILRELENLEGEVDDLESVEHQLRKDYQEEFEENGIARIHFKDSQD